LARQHLLKQYVALSFFPKALKTLSSETHDVLPTPSPTLRDPCVLPTPPSTIREPWCLCRPPPPHLHSETHGVFSNPSTCHQRPMVSFPNSSPKGGSRACMIVLTTSLNKQPLYVITGLILLRFNPYITCNLLHHRKSVIFYLLQKPDVVPKNKQPLYVITGLIPLRFN